MDKKVLFLADHWSTLDHERDSTLHLSQIARDQFGFECHWAQPENVFVKNSELMASIDGVLSSGADEKSLNSKKAKTAFSLNSYHSIHWRHDPPVGALTLRLWSLFSTQNLRILNAPRALLAWNEKFSTLRFKDWCIPSNIVSMHSTNELNALNLSKSKKWIIKPSSDAASRGVSQMSSSPSKRKSQIDKLVKSSGPWILIQEQDSKIFTHGETRAFILNRKIVGSLQKKGRGKNPIMSLDAPKSERPVIEKCGLTKIQKLRAEAIAKILFKEGVCLATIDFIDDRILEINVTSPGMLRWMDAGVSLEKQLGFLYWKSVIGRFGKAR